jgi:pSer/pThr/pTyr-binding forkhead associated (FHA) protein
MNRAMQGNNMGTNDSTNQDRHVLVINDGQRRAYALEAAAYSIGRDPSNAIVLKSDSISRQHALLLRVPAPGKLRYQYRIIDGNSSGKASANGLFVNEERCSSHELRNGDMIRFGQFIEASYLTVAMGEAEFAQYLESISYQSIKSATMNAKETVVASDVDWDALDQEIFNQQQVPTQMLEDATVINLKSATPSTQKQSKQTTQSGNAHSLSKNAVHKTTAHPWAKTVIEGNPLGDHKKLFFLVGGAAALLSGTILGAWFFLSNASNSSNAQSANAQTISGAVVTNP